MTRVVRIQTNFSSGEIDPLLRARVDLAQYYNALQTATNVVVQPQGGVKRRAGLKYIAELPAAANPQNGVRLIAFEFSVDDSYMFALVNQRIYIFRAGALVTNINGTGNDFLAVSAITSAMLSKIRHAQSADTMILTHEDLTPLKIVRGASNSTWTVSVLTFTNPPQYPFSTTLTNPGGTITPSGTTGNVTITASASIFHDGRSSTAQAGGSATITLDSGASSTDDIFISATITTTGGTGSGQTRIISDYVGSSKVATVSVAWATQPASDTTFTITSQANQYINVTGTYGRMRILSVTDATHVKAFCEIGLFDGSAIDSGDYEIESGYEDAWSATRGFPVSLTFHEGRLYFAGSRSLPTTFWASVVSNFFDFELGEGLDDQSVSASITTSSLNAIVDVFSGRDLQIFTTGGEFYIPQSVGEPITPGNLTVKVATRNGAKPGVPVAGLDSGTIFVQRQGKSLNELLFTDAELAYTTAALSLLSGHLLKSPTDMSIRRATSTEESDRLFIVNGDDGTMSVFSLNRAQQVIAPSSFTTDGNFKAVGIDIDTAYTIINRTVGAFATSTVTITNYSNLANGDKVNLIGGDLSSHDFTVGSSAGGGTWVAQTSNNQTATNLAAQINANAKFSASASGAVVTVTQVIGGLASQTTVTLTDAGSAGMSKTNFVNGTRSAYFVETFDTTLHTDCAVYSASSSATGAAAHLEGELLDVIVDGNVQADKTVQTGVVTFDRSSASNYEIGLPFAISIVTMPVEPRLQSGSIKGFKKRILEVNAEVHDSQAMTVNGQLVAFRQFGEDVLDSSVQKFTGIKKVGPLLGFTDEGTITVSQSVPLDLNLLALDYKLSVGV